MSHRSEHTDALLQLCLEGNQSAQLEIYNCYYKAMYNTALRIVKNRDEAEDVMQEAFLNAFTKLHTFKGEVTFGSWLKRIVINNSIYHYRKQQKRNEVAIDDILYKVKDNDEIDSDHGQTELKAQKVMEAMKRLKDNYRIALTLHLIEGYDYKEISKIMDMSYANCRTTISRAKESLRKKLINAWIMNDNELKEVFEKLKGSFDKEEPAAGHQERFLEKLGDQGHGITLQSNLKSYWKPLSIAASLLLLCAIGIGLYNTQGSINENVAEIPSEVSNTQFYFASLIEEQVKQMESESSPETKDIIEDTMNQLKKLEADFAILENDLRNGGNGKMLLSAMITNFQTRIDLLQDVLNQIEDIKTLKKYNDENFTI